MSGRGRGRGKAVVKPAQVFLTHSTNTTLDERFSKLKQTVRAATTFNDRQQVRRQDQRKNATSARQNRNNTRRFGGEAMDTGDDANTQTRGRGRGRGGFRGRGRPTGVRGRGAARGAARGGRGRGRGGRARPEGTAPNTAEALDEQLELYQSGNVEYLDAQLENYMKKYDGEAATAADTSAQAEATEAK